MSSIQRSELPTEWKFPGQLDGQMRSATPVDIPGGTWWRVLEDFGRGFPAFHIEHAWVAERDLRFATVAGFTFADEPDGVKETEVLERRCIPLSSVDHVRLNIGGGKDIVMLTNGETHDDWPAMLINQHLHP
jgi:hypothetical protein